jgi:hypothetical protein
MTDFNKKPAQPQHGTQAGLNKGPQQGPQAGLNKGNMGGKGPQADVKRPYTPNAQTNPGNKDRGR